ncbi:hypothetical protein KCU78_g2797, partial [Aureobasidium melanogenum]
MPPIQNWFKSRKPLRVSRKSYYEDIFGEKNPEEELEGVHIIDSDSDSDPGVFSRRSRRQGRKKPRITLRQREKKQADRGNKIGTADGDEAVAPRVDRNTVVTIDDDSDVEEQFVVDLQKHARGPDNKNNEDDIEGPESNQNEIDAAFMAEIKKSAAPPPPIDNGSNDELLERINRRAQEFAEQSPLGPLESLEDAANPLPSIEQRDRETSDEPTGRSSLGVPDDATDIGAIDSVAVMGTGRTSTTVAIREHSWDPSQGSDYVYSDEEAVNGLEHAKPIYESLRNDNDQDEDLHDTDDEDKESQVDKTQDDETYDGGHIISDVQRETNDGTAELFSTHEGSPVSSKDDNDDNNNREVIDLVSPSSCSSEEPPIRRTRSSRPSIYSLRNGFDVTTSPGFDETWPRKTRPFGLFASNAKPSIEPDRELSDDTPPRRLRDLVRKRAREREEREIAKKKIRYDLRPRRQQDNNEVSLSRGNASMAERLDSETDDAEGPRRVTRSMTARTESLKKPIPRFKAARKSAWPLVPKDNSYRRKSAGQIVQVIVPKVVDRSTWSSTPSPRTERRQLPAINEDLVTFEGENKMEPALAGKGIKRMTPNEEIDEEATVSKNGKQNLQFILID